MINRGKQHHAIARLCKGVNADRRAVDQPMGGENPTGVDGPVVPVLHPPRNGIKIGAVIPVIAENPVLGHLANHVLHAFWWAKIHISNPHGNPVFRRDTIFFFHVIPFARACAIAVDYLVELHEIASFFLPSGQTTDFKTLCKRRCKGRRFVLDQRHDTPYSHSSRSSA